MLVAWRRVHRRKGMRGGGCAREESHGAGAGGEGTGLGWHDYMWVLVRRKRGRWGYKDERLGHFLRDRGWVGMRAADW